MPPIARDYTPRDVYEFLLGQFKDIYGDVVIVRGEKPSEILFELEAAFTHMAVAHTNEAVAQRNLNAAMGHLHRAALDSAKILWLTYSNKIEQFFADSDLRQYCINCAEHEFTVLYREALDGGIDARHCELNNVGIDPTESLQKYYDAAVAMKAALDKVDLDKVQHFRRFRLRHWCRQHAIAFGLGIAASIVSGLLIAAFR